VPVPHSTPLSAPGNSHSEQNLHCGAGKSMRFRPRAAPVATTPTCRGAPTGLAAIHNQKTSSSQILLLEFHFSRFMSHISPLTFHLTSHSVQLTKVSLYRSCLLVTDYRRLATGDILLLGMNDCIFRPYKAG
jgi:hypothetical protein